MGSLSPGFSHRLAALALAVNGDDRKVGYNENARHRGDFKRFIHFNRIG